ncbi:MAG: HAMP domain-containing histidine kinase [Clostridia bacterium]|nr:HAMP domain-containing histidine kinase [Clostridia bacterium]
MTNRKEINGKKFVSFKTRNILSVLLALVLAVLTSLFSFYTGIYVINQVFLSEEAEAQRDKELYESFVMFVKENNVASTDSEKFDEWINQYNNNVYLTIYREDRVYLKDFEISGNQVVLPNTETNSNNENNSVVEDNLYSNYDRTVYSVAFSDGVCAVTIGHQFSPIYSAINFLITTIVFATVFFTITSSFNNYLKFRLKNLSKQVSSVSAEELNSPISLGGRDELAILALDIETMRSNLVEKINSENKAWKTNQELITSISHDIRNPLTSLVGYSDILHNKQYSSDMERENYQERCRDKIYRLKELTDELFKYTLVYSKPELEVNKTNEDASILLGQLIGEPLTELKSENYKTSLTVLINDVTVSVDVLILKRVFDNLFSNIRKYADLEKPVVATVTKNGYMLNVKLINFIKIVDNPIESSKIGLRTCERLCKSLDIDFSYSEKKEKFTTELFIPIVKIVENK